MRPSLTIYALVAAFAAPTLHADTAGQQPLTYEIFEAAVPHVDLDTCPAAMASDNTFCRATLSDEQIHVFAFSLDGDSPMVGFASYETTRLSELLN